MKDKYYQAYNERYKTIHQRGVSWSSEEPTPIVFEIVRKYLITKEDDILEIGCGEGRDASFILEKGYHLLATDISQEAIDYCQKKMDVFSSSFKVVDCLKDSLKNKYRYIYTIAVLHMLVLDEDRNKFYRFIRNHLKDDGVALVCSMGDGDTEIKLTSVKHSNYRKENIILVT